MGLNRISQSTQNVRDVLTQNQLTLKTAKQDLRDLIPSYPGLRSSILDSLYGDTVDSIPGDKESVISTIEFSFDAEIINTRTYKQSLAELEASRKQKRSSTESFQIPPERSRCSRSGSLARTPISDEMDVINDCGLSDQPASDS